LEALADVGFHHLMAVDWVEQTAPSELEDHATSQSIAEALAQDEANQQTRTQERDLSPLEPP
jgi:hypothetical protein